MRVLELGTLSSVSGAILSSTVSSVPIALTRDDLNSSNAFMWLSIEGDTGRTGGSVAVFWKGCYAKSGATYAMPTTGQYFVKSGTSISGQLSDGSYLKAFDVGMPFVRVCAVASKAGSTMQGTSATNTTSVKWVLGVS